MFQLIMSQLDRVVGYAQQVSDYQGLTSDQAQMIHMRTITVVGQLQAAVDKLLGTQPEA